MRIRKAVITAAGSRQRLLPLQALIDRDGAEKSVLAILLEEVLRAPVEEVAVVVAPGDEDAYRRAAGDLASRLRFLVQLEPRGYGHAIACAAPFTAGEPFLHLVGDHLYVPRAQEGCAARLVQLAESEDCSISAVQPTREHLLPNFGAVAGSPVAGRSGLYALDTVIEKPTPTEAEQRLIVPGLRSGYYLCFFGMHVLTPTVMDLLSDPALPSLSLALALLPRRERYLGLEFDDRRYDLGRRYGLLSAQLALALSGRDRNEVLAQLLELLAAREMDTVGH